ncbi:(Fe-S)-binding protein [Amycolatopsis endophytica]|uniref:Glycolate oxidase iron-sulfur subunit n=1 Tax=Amycolatopsis endophytica TaxID=860233 RepID=A0A853B023_9PSEU|nr:(Fe-S)-binding protein [Amycolatopsis endophytica]NYI88086.1 glycolate oxidase iron-sulfur subunit [Amycolatopsis endophytica]
MIFSKTLLDRCISCGYCLPACPTYAMTGDEASSPRGRISLMRALETGHLEDDDPTLAEQASFCLGCRACEPVCPAGVEYGNLLEEWRDHQWSGRRSPLPARLLMALVSRSWLVRAQGLVRRHARTVTSASGPSLMLGCVERGLFPRVSHAARKLAPGLSVPKRQGCCGALHAHNGDSGTGERMAKSLGDALPGTIVTTSGGCAAHLAAHVGRPRVRELSEYLVEHDHLPSGRLLVDGRVARVALQDSCHLRNGLGISRQPRELIRAVAEYVELPSAGACCGAAGTYSILRPRESGEILSVKIDEIEAAEVDFVVAVNPGCLRQLKTGLRKRGSRVRAVHLAELLVIVPR